MCAQRERVTVIFGRRLLTPFSYSVFLYTVSRRILQLLAFHSQIIFVTIVNLNFIASIDFFIYFNDFISEIAN